MKASWKETAEHFDKFVHFVEQNNHYNGAGVINFHILRNDFFMKHGQADIRNLVNGMSNQAEKSVEDDTRPAIHTPGSPRQRDSPMSMLEGETEELQR